MSNIGNKSIFESAKNQLHDKVWEIFLGVIAILFGLSFIGSFGIFILLVVLIGFPLAVITHNTKFFPFVTLLIGTALGIVLGGALFPSGLTIPLPPGPTAEASNAYRVIDPEQWLDLNQRVGILEDAATIQCTYTYTEIGWADCEITQLGRSGEKVTLTIKKDHLVTINGRLYSIILLSVSSNRVKIKTVYIPPSAYTPTP
jgi:hypothetical protein